MEEKLWALSKVDGKMGRWKAWLCFEQTFHFSAKRILLKLTSNLRPKARGKIKFIILCLVLRFHLEIQVHLFLSVGTMLFLHGVLMSPWWRWWQWWCREQSGADESLQGHGILRGIHRYTSYVGDNSLFFSSKWLLCQEEENLLEVLFQANLNNAIPFKGCGQDWWTWCGSLLLLLQLLYLSVWAEKNKKIRRGWKKKKKEASKCYMYIPAEENGLKFSDLFFLFNRIPSGSYISSTEGNFARNEFERSQINSILKSDTEQ